MSNAFFNSLDPQTAHSIAQLSHLMYELRETRKEILDSYDCDDESELLDAIRAERVPVHPGYAFYLSARILEQARKDTRRALMPQPDDAPPHCLHPALAEHVTEHFGSELAQPVELLRDALHIVLANGTDIIARFAADDAWSIEWQHADTVERLDTAPRADRSHPYPRPSGSIEEVLDTMLRTLIADPGILNKTT